MRCSDLRAWWVNCLWTTGLKIARSVEVRLHKPEKRSVCLYLSRCERLSGGVTALFLHLGALRLVANISASRTGQYPAHLTLPSPRVIPRHLMTHSNEAASVVGISQQVDSGRHLPHLGQKIGGKSKVMSSISPPCFFQRADSLKRNG